MDKEFEKRLDFDSDTFEEMKRDMNFVLQRLIGNMQEKGSDEGSMTLKIDVTMVKEFIPNYSPDIKGESREISKPQFKHKVTSVVKINDEKSGTLNNEMELVMDEETGVFKLVPICNTEQRSIFDSDFQQNGENETSNSGKEDDDSNIIEGTYTPLLPGPETENEDQGEEDAVAEEGTAEGTEPKRDSESMEELGEGLPDLTDELLGDDESHKDDYGYEKPEDDGK